MTLVEERLSDWLHGANLDPDGSDLPSFNAAVTAAAASATPQLGVDFVASAYGLDDGAEAACTALAAQLPATPDGAVLTPGALLTRRLSGAVVATALETRVDDAAKATGLAVAAADFVGLTPQVTEISQLAGNAVRRLARLARTPRALPDQRLKARVDAEMKTLPPADEAGAVNQVVRKSIEEMRASVRVLADLVDNRQQALELDVRRTSEEIDLLWWTLDPQVPGSLVAWEEAGNMAIVATGIAIAQRVAAQPPPEACVGLVQSALRRARVNTDERLPLAAVAESGRAIRIAPPLNGPSIRWAQPVLAALRAAHAPSAGDQWRPMFASATRLDPELMVSPAAAAVQLIRDIGLDTLLRGDEA